MSFESDIKVSNIKVTDRDDVLYIGRTPLLSRTADGSWKLNVEMNNEGEIKLIPRAAPQVSKRMRPVATRKAAPAPRVATRAVPVPRVAPKPVPRVAPKPVPRVAMRWKKV